MFKTAHEHWLPTMAFPVLTAPPAQLFPDVLLPRIQSHCFSLRSSQFLAQLISSKAVIFNPQKQSPSGSRKFVPASNNTDGANLGEEIEYVDVVGVGSRNKAVLDFCFNSPLLSPAFRFWNVVGVNSTNVQLQEWFRNQDIAPRIVEASSVSQSCAKAVIIVASAGYGSHDIEALNTLLISKSSSKIAAGIILKPFSFEGRRRHEEVNALVDKLQKYGSFYIAIDTDALLEKDMLTLDEALKASNNAVLMAINAISILISEKHTKLLHRGNNGPKELKVSEIGEILERHMEAKIAFGAGCDIKTSVLRAIYDCPFLSTGFKESDGPIICILVSSETDSQNCPDAILQTIRLTLKCKQDVIASVLHQPSLEPNLIVTTILTFGYSAQQTTQKTGLFHRLARHFPFILDILKKKNLQPLEQKESCTSESPHLSETISIHEDDEVPFKDVNFVPDIYTADNKESEPFMTVTEDQVRFLRDHLSNSEQGDSPYSETDFSSLTHSLNGKGVSSITEELLTRYRLGPDDQKANELSLERDIDNEIPPVLDSMNIYRLPVGVKHVGHITDFPVGSTHQSNWRVKDSGEGQADAIPMASSSGVFDGGPEATVSSRNFMSNRLNYASDSNKQGVLSSRASSMLEAERDSEKKWNPVVEMTYRGGTYRGRSQGGLPDGKGRLSLGDGSVYEGMWRYGKKSGVGTFYFNNGDVFQGSWRDDAMHGKGWFYFHSGDRWFANFWKGKANGEGRFYSKLGDVFFGQFKDGWRHGSFLCITEDGERFHEVWEEGVLVSREKLDPDADAA